MTARFSAFARPMVVIAAAASLSACGINTIPTAEENAKAKWGDVQAAFQERANLIPNLTQVAKASSAQEKEILTGVIEARAKATSPQIQLSADDLRDPAKVTAFQNAQNQLSSSLGGLGRLLANVEAYPQLQSINNYTTLMSQIEGQENRIRVAIRDYNAAVQAYNTTIRTFPDAIGAKVIYGSKPMISYQSVTPGAEVAPNVGDILKN